MKIKSNILLIVLIFSNLFPINHAFAIYNGKSALGSNLVLAILPENGARYSYCSGALISESIVLTAAHCVIADQNQNLMPRFQYGDLHVSAPGVDISKDNLLTRVKVSKTIISRGYVNVWLPENKDYRTQINDIALLVLEKPLVKNYKIEIATDLEIESAISSGSEIIHYGYGMQNLSGSDQTPWTAKLNLFRQVMMHLDSNKVVTTREGTSALCPGDSGGPWYLEINGVTKLVGNHVAASGCRGNPPYNGYTIGTRLNPYINLLNTGIDIFETERTKVSESNRQIAEAKASDQFLIDNYCYPPGGKAQVQIYSNGEWVQLVNATGWIHVQEKCLGKYEVSPWARINAPNGSNLRWMIESSWGPKISQSIIWHREYVFKCKRGAKVNKIIAYKVECPKGFKLILK